MVNAEYDLKEARANKFQKDAIALARKLENIELNRQKAILDASLDLYRQTRSTAEGRASMGTTSSLGQSTPQSAPTGDRGIIERLTGDPSSPYYRADHGGDNYHEHLAFATVAARDAAIEALERAGIRVGSTYREGDPGYHGANLALDVPASQVPLGQEVRMSRDVEQALSEAGFTGFGIGGPQSQVLGPPRQIDSNEARNIEQTQQAKFSEESLKRTIEYSKEKAEIERRNAIETAEAQLFNLENLKLEVELAEEKNSLISSGLNDEEIQLQLELLELREKSKNLLEVIKKDMIANGKTQEEMNLKVEEHNLELQESIRYQKELNERKKETKFLSEIRALDQRQNLAFAFTPGEERRRQLEQEYTPEQADTIASREEEIMRIEELRDKFRGIAQSIGDSFGEAFKNIIAGSGSVRENLSNMFQSIADSFADMAAQMIAEAVKMQAMKAMQGLFSFFAPGSSIIGGGAAAGGSLLGSLSQSAASGLGGLGGFAGPSAIPWGFADGGIMTDKGPMPLKLYASGGIANSPQLAVFGEGSTPEAFVPLPDGRSIPVKFTGDGGMKDSSGGDVIVNVQVDANDSKVSGNAQEGNQLGKVIAGAVQSEIIKQKRPGGLLSE